VETATLLVSELASNAVLHARSPFLVSVRQHEHALTVAVVDGSETRPEPREITPTRGRGLRLVETLANDWGVCPREGGKAVYFRLPC
jgi:anti-sigma regulatory factor (Ser/Thr protein kinase)